MPLYRSVILCSLAIWFSVTSCKEGDTKNSGASRDQWPVPIYEGIDHALINPPVQILPSLSDSTSFSAVFHSAQNNLQSEVQGTIEELNFSSDASLIVNNREYSFLHLHFHSPGPHLVEGVTHPLELHVVTVPTESRSVGEYLIIAILMKLGQANPFIEEVLNPTSDLGKSRVEALNGILLGGRAMINKTNLDIGGFYKYSAPLASKPFSESVDWYIGRKTFEISVDQLEKIKNFQD